MFNSGAASAYANSFRQRSPYGGFEKVKSNIGTDTFANIPFLNYKTEVEMAQAALQEAGASQRQKMVNDTTFEINKMRYDKDGDKFDPKKAALVRMLSSGTGMAAGGGGGSGTKSALFSMLGNRQDPLKRALDITQTNTALDADDAARDRPFEGALAAGLRQINQNGSQSVAPAAPPKSGGGQMQVPQTPTTQLQTPAAPSLKSKVSVEDIMQKVFAKRQTEGATE